MRMRLAGCFITALGLCAGLGCQNQAGRGGYETVTPKDMTESPRAAEITAKAADLIKSNDLAAAEKELKAALTMDLFYGPAHNDLGIVYYRQEKYYEAAWEFQYAAKLMPGKAEPKNNLGMVYESVGRLDESAKWYDEALALGPDDTEVTGNLARVLVRSGHRDEKTKLLLSDIVMKDRRPEWVAWAREQLVFIGQPTSSAAHTNAGRPVSPNLTQP